MLKNAKPIMSGSTFMKKNVSRLSAPLLTSMFALVAVIFFSQPAFAKSLKS